MDELRGQTLLIVDDNLAFADNLREIIRLLRKAAPGEPANR